jgi:hypothetical protein
MARPDVPLFHGIIGRTAPMRALFAHGSRSSRPTMVATAIRRLSTSDRVRLTTVNFAGGSGERVVSWACGLDRSTVFRDEIGDRPLDAQGVREWIHV